MTEDGPSYDVWDDLGFSHLVLRCKEDLEHPDIPEGARVYVMNVNCLMERRGGEWVKIVDTEDP